MKTKIFLSLLALSFLNSCASANKTADNYGEDISNISSNPISADLNESIQNFKVIFGHPSWTFSASTCEDLMQWSKQLDTFNLSEASANPKDIFQLKLALREKFKNHYEAQLQHGAQAALPKCIDAMKATNRVYRQIEDYFIVKSAANSNAQEPVYFFNPHYGSSEKNQFKQGDVLVSGGGAATSWLFSKAVDPAGSMSSIALVYGSTESGSNSNVKVIEANIETGITVTPIEDYFKENKGRFSVYRFTDPTRLNWAAEGAKKLFTQTKEKNGAPVCFDRKFLPEDFTCLTPVKVVTKAFLLGSGNEFVTPLTLNEFPDELTQLQKLLGVESQRAGVISDFELDFRFDLVAEWRIPSELPKLRRIESAFSAINKWLDKKYIPIEGSVQSIKLKPISNSRFVPFFSDRLKEKFPLTFEPRLTAWFVPTADAAEYLTKKLTDTESSQGIMTVSQQLAALDFLLKKEELNLRSPATQKSPLLEAFRRLK